MQGALGRQHHHRGAHHVVLVVRQRRQEPSSSVSRMSCRRLGLTACRTQPTRPFCLSFRNLLEVAGATGDREVRVIGDRFVVAHVALAAVARLLARMPVFGRLGVAGQADHIGVRREAFLHVETREVSDSAGVHGSALSTVAGEAQRVGMPRSHQVLSPLAVAGHAGLVSRRQCRQALARFVAAAALARAGRAGSNRAGVGNAPLGVGMVGSRGSGGNPDQPAAAARHGAEPPDRRRPNHDSRRMLRAERASGELVDAGRFGCSASCRHRRGSPDT